MPRAVVGTADGLGGGWAAMAARTLAMLATVPVFVWGMASPPSFTLNMSATPRMRWYGALSLVSSSWDDTWLPVFETHNKTLFASLSYSQWRDAAAALRRHFPEQAEELMGIADDFARVHHQYVSFEYLAGWVYFHELAHSTLLNHSAIGTALSRECTGLIAEDIAGNVFHVANMDQSPEAVRKLTLHVLFTDGHGNTLFEGVDWYWFTTGVSRAIRAGLASVQENWRASVPLLDTAAVFAAITTGVAPQIFVFRQAFFAAAGRMSQKIARPEQRAMTLIPDEREAAAATDQFEALVSHLSLNELVAPYYVVIAGTSHGQGAVLARDPSGLAAPPLRLSRDVGSPSNWSLVQTNYDHWVPDPAFDPRRTSAEAMLQQFGRARAASALGLFAIASAYPVHNPHTAFTAVMSAATGTMHAFVRDAMCPEDSAAAPKDPRYCAHTHAETAPVRLAQEILA